MNKKWRDIILLILTGGLIIFWSFPNIPSQLVFDEVEFAKLALSLKNSPYIVYSPLATGHTTMYFYIILTSFEIFGISNFALRLPSAIFGLVAPIIFYLLLKQIPLFSNTQAHKFKYNFLPVALAVLFVGQRWYFNFARFGFELTLLILLELVSLLILFIFLKQHRNYQLILSGVFAGLAYHSYMPGRIFLALPIFTLFVYYLSDLRKLRFKAFLTSSLIFLLPAAVIITPLQLHFAKNQDIRSYQQFYLANNNLSVSERIKGTWQNISSTTLMFFWKGDVNARHNYPLKPALNPIMALFFIVGLISAAWNWHNRFNLIFLFYFVLAIIPAIITYPWENPNMLRTGTVIPSLIYFVGLALTKLAIYIKNPNKFIFITVFFIVVSISYDLQTYYRFQVKEFNLGSGITGDIRENLQIK